MSGRHNKVVQVIADASGVEQVAGDVDIAAVQDDALDALAPDEIEKCVALIPIGKHVVCLRVLLVLPDSAH